MTTIALKKTEVISISSDSRISAGYSNDDWVSKVIKNGDYTFAVAGHLKAMQLLEFSTLPPVPPTNLDRFVTVEVAPLIESLLEGLRADILMVLRGEVYEIDQSGAWIKSVNGLYAVGSGMEYALGAMSAGASPEVAVKIAAQYDSGTGGTVNSQIVL